MMSVSTDVAKQTSRMVKPKIEKREEGEGEKKWREAANRDVRRFDSGTEFNKWVESLF